MCYLYFEILILFKFMLCGVMLLFKLVFHNYRSISKEHQFNLWCVCVCVWGGGGGGGVIIISSFLYGALNIHLYVLN